MAAVAVPKKIHCHEQRQPAGGGDRSKPEAEKAARNLGQGARFLPIPWGIDREEKKWPNRQRPAVSPLTAPAVASGLPRSPKEERGDRFLMLKNTFEFTGDLRAFLE